MQLPETPSDRDLKIPFHDYQKYVRYLAESTPYIGLFLDMGLGKTAITLSALYDLNPKGHVLIVAPKTIARSTWQDEIRKWNIPLRTKSFVCKDNGVDLSRKKREELYAEVPNEPPTVYFANRDIVVWLVKNMPVVNGRPVWYFPTVVLDESQSFKSHKSERFKALQKVRPCISRLIELTGTPTPKGLMDLWAQVWLLDQGQRLGRNITAYRNQFFFESKFANGFPVDWTPLHGSEEEIHRRISDITVSIKNPNLVLPPVTYNDIPVYMDKPEKERYKYFLKQQVLPLTKDITIIAPNAAVLQNKLSQIASGTIYTGEENPSNLPVPVAKTGKKTRTMGYEIIHDKKLDVLEYLVQNTGSPVLVAYWFNCDRDRILDRIKNAVAFDGKPATITAWNRGEIPVMLIHPASDGFGLNLQEGGHTLVWYTLPWSLEAYIQTNARIARQGQKHPVMIHRILTDGTVDGKILRALESKDLTEKALLDAISVTLSEAEKD